jgi:hypothetical protein
MRTVAAVKRRRWEPCGNHGSCAVTWTFIAIMHVEFEHWNLTSRFRRSNARAYRECVKFASVVGLVLFPKQVMGEPSTHCFPQSK